MKSRSCLSRKCNNGPLGGMIESPAEKGYVLLIVMMMAALLLISLAAAAPSIYVEGQREKEKELIFRGEQYARAIELFHAQFHRYPTSVKELLHTNDMSFLRQPFRDPMTKSGAWRFMHATATGVVLDSKILGPPGKQKTPPAGNNSQGGNPANGQPAAGQQPAAGSPQQSGPGTNTFSLSGLDQNSAGSQQGSTSSSGDNKIKGAFIVGVASTSHQQSIGVFDHRTEYDEWEFLGIPGAPGAPNIGGTSVVPSVGAQPGQSSSGPGSQSNSSGGFHLSPSQPSGPHSMFGGNPNPK